MFPPPVLLDPIEEGVLLDEWMYAAVVCHKHQKCNQNTLRHIVTRRPTSA